MKNWVKVELTAEQTARLYNILQTLANEANVDSGIRDLNIKMPSAIKTFDGGRFLIEDDLTLSLPSKKVANKRSGVSIKSSAYKHRLNLSVIKVAGRVFYRLFVSHRNDLYYWDWPNYGQLKTDQNILQISIKERLLTRLCPANNYVSAPYKSKFVTYREYYEAEKPDTWSYSSERDMLLKKVEYRWDNKVLNDCQEYIESITEDIVSSLVDNESFGYEPKLLCTKWGTVVCS